MRALRDPAPAAPQRSGVCLFDESWHQGVVGLVASRVKERVRRPVIAFALRGCARRCAARRARCPACTSAMCSMPIAARQPGMLIEKFGGHAMAAGLTLERAQLDAFARAFDAEVARCAGAWRGSPMRSRPTASWRVEEMALATGRRRCAPAVPGGRRFPSRCSMACSASSSARVVGERHLKMWVEVPRSARRLRCHRLQSRRAETAAVRRCRAAQAQLVYRLDVNEYQGERRLQLLVITCCRLRSGPSRGASIRGPLQCA